MVQEMSFKDISIFSSNGHFLQPNMEPFVKFWTIWGTFLWNYFEFGPVKWRLKIFLLSALEAILLSRVNHLCNFGRGHYGEHLCEIILNFDQLFRRCHLKKKFTHHRCRPITIAHFQPLTRMSLKCFWLGLVWDAALSVMKGYFLLFVESVL